MTIYNKKNPKQSQSMEVGEDEEYEALAAKRDEHNDNEIRDDVSYFLFLKNN